MKISDIFLAVAQDVGLGRSGVVPFCVVMDDLCVVKRGIEFLSAMQDALTTFCTSGFGLRQQYPTRSTSG